MTPEAPASAAALVVRIADTERSLLPGRAYTIGRDPQSDIVLTDSRVSWRHAVVRMDGADWVFEDTGSTNGSFSGQRRIQRLAITAPLALRLGHADDGVQLSASVAVPARHPAVPPQRPPMAPPAGPVPPVARIAGAGARILGDGVSQSRLSGERPPSAVMRLPSTLLRIGRATDNQVVVDDLSVSRYHAELRKQDRGGYVIVDLGSHNGSFVNGQRVVSAPVTELDIIGIGPATFRLAGDELREFLDTGDVSLIANDLTVTLPGGKVLLDHVSFPLGERCLLGVIGPSGAGKSTLLGALTGMRPATSGDVFYDDRDLYANYSELRHRIGLVPQENILHTQLTARRALGYAAELRFPRDTSKAEREHRIDEVLGELALARHAETRTSSLSGGQQKRVNVALELLTKPSLLFLDEPTSGLDPGLDKSVMEQMADLAHEGRTVIVVTHSVANLDLCDRLLVLVPGGKIAYFGAPRDGLRHFGKPGWAEVFQAFENEPDRDWAGDYRRSDYFRQYVASAMDGAAAAQHHPRPAPAPAPKSRNQFAQTSTLVRRYVAVLGSDKVFLIVLVLAVVGLGALMRIIPFPEGFVPGRQPNADAQSQLMILIMGASFAGVLNGIREIVKEKAIYSRERATGLGAGAYLMSKLLVLGTISAIQGILLTFVGLAGDKFPPRGAALPLPLLEIALAAALAAVACLAIGLLLSTVAGTQERAIFMLFLPVMVQVITSGGIFPVYGKAGLEQFAAITPARWAFAACASTVDLNKLQLTVGGDPAWKHTSAAWLTDLGFTVALFAAYSLLAWWRLAKVGPAKRR